ncbi:MAG: PEP-CTERM sorting domain-containing protein [Verrucomicrobiales bacterium]|jgi:hypothetical protein|nr:PEP-CTERM sorting domain-containing protein [Verrucomicrobiales bacterium]
MKLKLNQPKFKLLLLLSALSVSALNVFAANKVVTSSTTESNQSYDDSDTTTQSALNVTTSGVTYTGTNITLSATNSAVTPLDTAIGNGAYIDNGASLSLTGGSITTSGSFGHGVYLINASSGTLNNVTIKSEGYGSYGVRVEAAATTLTLTGANISTKGRSAPGIVFLEAGSGTVSNVNIETTGIDAHGVCINTTTSLNTSTLTLTDANISVTGGGANALDFRSNSTVTVNLNSNTITGNIRVIQAATLTLSGSNGTVITGNVSGTTGAVIGITLSDAGTKLVGNVSRTADSEINLTLGAGALFHGGGTLNNLTLDNGAILGYTNGLLVTDSITIGDGIIIDFSNLTETGAYTVLDWNGATITGGTISEDQFSATNLSADLQGSFSVAGNQLTFNASAVPEPSTWFLLGAGLGVIGLTIYRRRQVRL